MAERPIIREPGLVTCGAPRLYSRGLFCVFGGTRRAYSTIVAEVADKAGEDGQLWLPA